MNPSHLPSVPDIRYSTEMNQPSNDSMSNLPSCSYTNKDQKPIERVYYDISSDEKSSSSSDSIPFNSQYDSLLDRFYQGGSYKYYTNFMSDKTEEEPPEYICVKKNADVENMEAESVENCSEFELQDISYSEKQEESKTFIDGTKEIYLAEALKVKAGPNEKQKQSKKEIHHQIFSPEMRENLLKVINDPLKKTDGKCMNPDFLKNKAQIDSDIHANINSLSLPTGPSNIKKEDTILYYSKKTARKDILSTEHITPCLDLNLLPPLFKWEVTANPIEVNESHFYKCRRLFLNLPDIPRYKINSLIKFEFVKIRYDRTDCNKLTLDIIIEMYSRMPSLINVVTLQADSTVFEMNFIDRILNIEFPIYNMRRNAETYKSTQSPIHTFNAMNSRRSAFLKDILYKMTVKEYLEEFNETALSNDISYNYSILYLERNKEGSKTVLGINKGGMIIHEAVSFIKRNMKVLKNIHTLVSDINSSEESRKAEECKRKQMFEILNCILQYINKVWTIKQLGLAKPAESKLISFYIFWCGCMKDVILKWNANIYKC